MRITVSGIAQATFTRYDDRKLYNYFVTKALRLQPNLSEPEARQQFCIFLGRYVVKTFKQAIRSQALYGESFSQMYPPLNPGYNKSKGLVKGKNKVRAVNARDKFYINSKWLYDHFSYWVKDEEVFIGFHKVTRHPSGPKAQELLKWLDEGTANMQARPLVSLIIDEIASDFERFVNMYLEFVENRIKELKGQDLGNAIVQALNEEE